MNDGILTKKELGAFFTQNLRPNSLFNFGNTLNGGDIEDQVMAAKEAKIHAAELAAAKQAEIDALTP